MPNLITQEIKQVKVLRDDEGKTFQEIANELQFSERTARRRYAAAWILEEILEEDTLPDVQLPQIEVTGPYLNEVRGRLERFTPMLQIGDAMVTCDWHIPLHDPYLVDCMISYARENNIKTLIIAGDYFHMETFGNYLPYQPEASLEQEKYDGNLIMKTLCQTFDNIDMIWGNHDFRLSKKLGYKKSFEECMRWMLSELTEEEWSKIRISNLDHMMYIPFTTSFPDQVFRICHQENYSSVPLTVARKLAAKYSCSMITTHSHHLALGVAQNGVDICIEGGGFFHKERTEYIQRSNANHEWVNGFTMFKNGIPTLIGPAFGNHNLFLRKEETDV